MLRVLSVSYARHSSSCIWCEHSLTGGKTQCDKQGDESIIKVSTEKYYAVYYDKTFYIGCALSLVSQEFVKSKFLHSVPDSKFAWPTKDDIDCVHKKFIFFGPLTLEGVGPFRVAELKSVQCTFKQIKTKGVKSSY